MSKKDIEYIKVDDCFIDKQVNKKESTWCVKEIYKEPLQTKNGVSYGKIKNETKGFILELTNILYHWLDDV